MNSARKLRSVFLGNLLRKSNINKKPLIFSHDKIVMKFGKKKMGELGFGQRVRKLPEN